MSCIKKYEARGMMEWHPLLPAGKTHIRIPFTGGHLSGYGTTPASFETGDAVLQRVIEHSPHFRSGRIRLASTVRKNPDTLEPRRFSTLKEASDWLVDELGVTSSRTLDESQCREEAAKKGFRLEIKSGISGDKGGTA